MNNTEHGPAVKGHERRSAKNKPRTRSALVLYGTETGNAQDLADEVGRLTERLRFETTVIDLDSIELQDLVNFTIVIVVLSTTGQGEFPQNARSFWRVLLSRQLRPGVLRRVNFTTFGLGDSSYPRYNVAHRMLHTRLLQLGAQLFCPRGEGNEQHPEGHTGEFRSWILDLKDSLLTHFPLGDGQEIISEGVFLEPKWILESADVRDSSTNGVTAIDTLVLTPETPPAQDLIPINDAVVADLTSNTRLTPSDHTQDVRLLDLSIKDEIEYGPGAVAVVYPKNFPKDVEQFIRDQEWQDVADVQIKVVPTKRDADLKTYPPSPLRHISTGKQTFTLRELLTNYLDILSIPRRTFFSNLAYFTKETNEDEEYQKERILELANPELIDELWDYTTRPKRTILEIMPDFPSIRIPWQYALTILPIMRGRQFSIASGGTLKSNDNGGTRVQLLVAIANPPNPIIKFRKRYGVCTRYIATLEAGQQIALTIQPGYLNVGREELQVPILMVGPGTGVAPMRSMIHERRQWARDMEDTVCASESYLFFGCRNEGADYFFREEWEGLSGLGLTVFPGFSRDKDKPRTYVQELLRKNASIVREVLLQRQGKIYICGASGNMPKGVREALLEIMGGDERFQSQEGDQVEAYLDELEREGRYRQETW
ncbi:hypothetical protein AAFC00_004062 [Neodothiora populina]|uniref:NADPH-dependent diflavin oxidoreductase 1 n=1 Tax=Neodothiora populina TaxID=2781224 RepID=A0ABR3PIH6_9PEZI